MLRRFALEATALRKSFDEGALFSNLDLAIEVGSRVAIIGPNGIGKTTLARCLLQDLGVDHGTVKWAENADIGYFSQDHTAEFSNDMTVFEWISQWRSASCDDQLLRATLGRMLFSRDDSDKSIKVLSGGEESRMLFGKLTLRKPNVMVMDEPTNHLDVRHQLQLLETLRASGRTVVATIHDLSMAASHFDRVVVLADGGVLATGPAEEALSPSNVATAFHVIAHHVTTPEGSRELVCTAALPEPSRKEI